MSMNYSTKTKEELIELLKNSENRLKMISVEFSTRLRQAELLKDETEAETEKLKEKLNEAIIAKKQLEADLSRARIRIELLTKALSEDSEEGGVS